MKVFISQPMNGMSDQDILERRKQLIELAKQRCGNDVEIIDSFTKSEDIIGRGRIAMLGDSIALMRDADVVLFARGWKTSAGCKVEHEVCVQYNIRRLFEELIPDAKPENAKYWR